MVVSAFGDDPLQAVDELLSIEAQPPPDTASLAPTDVVVAVKSAGVGWVDLLMTSGQYQHMASPPYTPGLEYSGVVAWKGAGVVAPHLEVGAPVMADGFLTGPRSVGAHRQYGGFASWAVAPAQALLPLPSGFSFDEACSFLGNYETAYHCLIARGRLRAGETVLIPGATGATGLAAVQVAKLVGATVIAVGRSREKLAVVAAQGADHVVCSAMEDGTAGVRRFRDEVKALTDGRGVDVVYDGVGGDVSLECLRCVSFGARFVIVGWASTPNVAKGRGQRGAPNVNVLPTNLIMMKSLDVLGSPTVIATLHDPAIRTERLARLLAWANDGHLRPMVSKTFVMDDVKLAMRAKWNGEAVGSCVLHPAA